MKRFFAGVIVLILFYSGCGVCNAKKISQNKASLNEISLNEILQAKAGNYCKVLSYDDVLKTALENSFDLKTAKINIDISRQKLSEAKREYIPDVNIGVNTGYTKGLNDSSQGVKTINGTIINESTRYQNAASVSLQHTFIDYGIRRNNRKIAKFDIEQKQTIKGQTLRDLKITILELYTDILTSYIELTNLKKEQELLSEILVMKERLYKAGLISKIEVKQSEADINSLLIQIENKNLSFAEALFELSFYTDSMYDMNVDIKCIDCEEPSVSEIDAVDYTKSAEFISYEREIDKKKLELTILKKQMLPQVSAYSSYSLYGEDKNSYSKSFSDISQSSVSIGLSTGVALSGAFKQTPKIKQLELEIKSLENEQQARVTNFFKEVNKTKQLLKVYESQKLKNSELKIVLDTKIKMLEKLDNQRLINRTDLYEQIIQNNRQYTEFALTEQKAIAGKIKLAYLLEDENADSPDNI